MRKTATAMLATGMLLITGCGEASHSESPAPTTARHEALRCQRAGKALVASLRASLRHGVALDHVSVVEADAADAPVAGFRRGVYAVAGKLTGPGVDGQVAVWAVSRDMARTGGGLAIGADSVTREFSELGSAAQSGSPAADYAESIAESEAGKLATDCAGG